MGVHIYNNISFNEAVFVSRFMQAIEFVSATFSRALHQLCAVFHTVYEYNFNLPGHMHEYFIFATACVPYTTCHTRA